MSLQIFKFSKHFLNSFKIKMSFERAIVSKSMLPLIVPHESSDKRNFLRRFFLLRRTVYHSQEFPEGLSFAHANKILRAASIEKVRTKLRNVAASSIQYSEFLRICIEACDNPDKGAEFAKFLDHSGNVVVLGNSVFLRPEQVAKLTERLINQSIAIANLIDPIKIRMELEQQMELEQVELEHMVKQKAMMDDKAKTQVRIELYLGLSFLTVLTLGFGFTCWELICWDVMGHILLSVTFYGFALSYLFFLKTSTEPSCQGLYFRRLRAKHERLMKTYNFDMNRYNELCKTCYPSFHAAAK